METMILDVVHEDGESVQSVVDWLTHDLQITARVLSEHGSGGGWPEIEFTGELTDLIALCRRGGYDEDHRMYLVDPPVAAHQRYSKQQPGISLSDVVTSSCTCKLGSDHY